MSSTFKIMVDPKAPASDELMRELELQVEALKVGNVSREKGLPPEGTLTPPDPATIMIILGITHYSLRIALSILEIAREVREKIAAQKGQPLEETPHVTVVVIRENSEPVIIDTSLTNQEQERLLCDGRESEDD